MSSRPDGGINGCHTTPPKKRITSVHRDRGVRSLMTSLLACRHGGCIGSPLSLSPRVAERRSCSPCTKAQHLSGFAAGFCGHDQHAHATRPAPLPRRTNSRSPWR
eukprot:7359049-Prymnesium_polylepis.1